MNAENHIRNQFKMERIVYCQDNIYLDDLRSTKAEILGKDGGKEISFASVSDKNAIFIQEMISHTKAYFTVSLQPISPHSNALWLAFPMGTSAGGWKDCYLPGLGERRRWERAVSPVMKSYWYSGDGKTCIPVKELWSCMSCYLQKVVAGAASWVLTHGAGGVVIRCLVKMNLALYRDQVNITHCR